MNRVIAVVACGLALSACNNSSWMPSLPSMPSMPSLPSPPSFSGLNSFFRPEPASLKVESVPSGADATAAGKSCRTPCTLAFDASGDFSVDVSLTGYIPQSVSVTVLSPEDPRFASDGAARGLRLDPDQVFVELKPVQPVARKRGRAAR